LLVNTLPAVLYLLAQSLDLMVKLVQRGLSGLTEQLCTDGHFDSLAIKKPFPNARSFQ
jgi:hypothetical protein